MIAVYLLIPVWGQVSQRTSPRLLSLLSATGFSLGYLMAAWEFSGAPHTSGPTFIIVLAVFCLIGAATSATLMGSIAAIAATFEGSPYIGIALAAPVACFGISGLVESRLALLFVNSEGVFEVVKYFIALATVLLSTGVVGAVGLRTPGRQKPAFDSDTEDPAGFEERDLLDSPVESSPHHYGTVQQPISSTSDEDRPLCESRRRHSLKHPESSTMAILKDPVLWLLAVASLLIAGPCEVYNMNVSLSSQYRDLLLFRVCSNLC